MIGYEGQQLGIVPIEEALRLAEEETFDLVEVSANATPPVCRILDYGKYKYKLTKKEKEAKKKQHVIKVKEVKLRPAIDEHDYLVKLDSAKKFLEKANKVKLTMMFRGRELAHKEIGEGILVKFCQEITSASLGSLESEPKMIGRAITVVIAPSKTH